MKESTTAYYMRRKLREVCEASSDVTWVSLGWGWRLQVWKWRKISGCGGARSSSLLEAATHITHPLHRFWNFCLFFKPFIVSPSVLLECNAKSWSNVFFRELETIFQDGAPFISMEAALWAPMPKRFLAFLTLLHFWAHWACTCWHPAGLPHTWMAPISLTKRLFETDFFFFNSLSTLKVHVVNNSCWVCVTVFNIGPISE